MQMQVEDKSKISSCGCGRSPTGYCSGLHHITDAQYEYFKSLCGAGEISLTNDVCPVDQLRAKLSVQINEQTR